MKVLAEHENGDQKSDNMQLSKCDNCEASLLSHHKATRESKWLTVSFIEYQYQLLKAALEFLVALTDKTDL